MARGRAPNLSLPPTRALTQQREYRARKAAKIEELEKANRELTAENTRLKAELQKLRTEIGRDEESRTLQATRIALHQALAQIDRLLPEGSSSSVVASASILGHQGGTRSSPLSRKRKRTTGSPETIAHPSTRKASSGAVYDDDDESEDDDEEADGGVVEETMGDAELPQSIGGEVAQETEDIKPKTNQTGDVSGAAACGSGSTSSSQMGGQRKSCCGPKAPTSNSRRASAGESAASTSAPPPLHSTPGMTFAANTFDYQSVVGGYYHQTPYSSPSQSPHMTFQALPNQVYRAGTPGPIPHYHHAIPVHGVLPQPGYHSFPYPTAGFSNQSGHMVQAHPTKPLRIIPPSAGYDPGCCNGLFDCSSLPEALRPTMHQMSINVSGGGTVVPQTSFERDGMGDTASVSGSVRGSVSGSARGSSAGLGDYGGGYQMNGNMVEMSVHIPVGTAPTSQGGQFYQDRSNRSSSASAITNHPMENSPVIMLPNTGLIEEGKAGSGVGTLAANDDCCFGLVPCTDEERAEVPGTMGL